MRAEFYEVLARNVSTYTAGKEGKLILEPMIGDTLYGMLKQFERNRCNTRLLCSNVYDHHGAGIISSVFKEFVQLAGCGILHNKSSQDIKGM